MKDLSHYRKSYEKSALDESEIPDDPLALFIKWFHETEELGSKEDEVNAMTVSTIGLDGFPKARVVLLKRFDQDGYTFFTNYNSEKGRAITANPNVCLSFFWHSMERQVIIKGVAEKTSDAVSDAYFDSRPPGSRLGAIISEQSKVITSRTLLDDKLKRLEIEFEGKDIPRPKHWGGYVVKPQEVEFWQGRQNRLHDRITYKFNGNSWDSYRLAP